MTSNNALTLYEQMKRDIAQRPPALLTGRGRLIFALDATASREPTWDHACHVQGEMFEATTGLRPLEIKLAFYRGFDECKVSRPLYSAAELHRVMRAVRCVGGHTQIERILDLAIREAQTDSPPSALIFVGDAMEERLDLLCHLAGALGTRHVPIFLLHEGDSSTTGRAFQQLAKLSGGACLPFDLSSIDRLKALLGAIAVFVTGGHVALESYAAKTGGDVLQLTHQLRKGP